MRGTNDTLQEAVYRTIAWFSIFEYPVTAFEVYKWMLEPEELYTLGDIYRVLDSEWMGEHLQTQDGFYAVKRGSLIGSLIKTRHERFLLAARKFTKAKCAARFLQTIPSIRAVAVCNTLAWSHTTEESDIDFFVITRPGTIWSSRLFAVTPFALLKKRPEDKGVQDPYCFSFFNTTDSLGLQPYTLDPDPYFAYWTQALVPLFDQGNVFGSFYKENKWARQYLPHAEEKAKHHTSYSAKIKGVKWFGSHLFESLARKIQKNKMPDEIKMRANTDTCIVVTEDVLKFHLDDRREKFRQELESLVGEYQNEQGNV